MSFLLDLIGSAAAAGSKGIGEYQEQERALERQREAEKGAMNRAVELDKIRGERAETERLAKMKRMSEQTQDVEAKATAEGEQRQLSAAQRMAPSVDANVLETIKAKLTPEQMEKFYGVKDNALSRVDDQISVARREGYYDLEEQLKSAREATRKAIAEEYARATTERKLDQTDRKQDELEKNNERRHKESLASIGQRRDAAEGRSTKTSAAVEKLNTQKSNTLREIELLQNSISKAKWGSDPKLKAANDRLDQINNLLSSKWEKDVNGEDAPAPAKTKTDPAKRPSLDSFKR